MKTTSSLASAFLGLAALGSVLTAGCAGEIDPGDGGSTGSVQLQLSTPDPGTYCLVIDAAGPTRTRRWSSNQGGVFTTSLTLTDVPTGSVRWNAAEYEGVCADDGPPANAVLAWIADEQRVQINPGITAELSLVLHPASGAVGGGSVTFQTPVVEVAAGAASTYAVLSDGRLFAWGENGSNELGDGSTADRTRPVQVPGLAHVEHVIAGQSHACALLGGNGDTAGQVWCWGKNDHGQVGIGGAVGGSVSHPTQVALPGSGYAVDLAAGATHTCALLLNGGLTCWGSNANGELGQGPTADRSSPTQALIDSATEGGFVQVGAGGSGATSFTCVLRNLGTVTCSQLSGAAPSAIGQLAPVVGGPIALASLAVGWGQRNAVRADGQVLSWTAATPAPVFSDVTDAVQAASGDTFSCALRTGGTVMCAGSNMHGQLGDGTGVATAANVSRRAAGLTKVVQVAAGQSHACAVTDVGALFCWGRNRQFQLGLGDQQSRFVPVRVNFPSN